MIDIITQEVALGTIGIIITLWTIPWKGYALWVAARNKHKWWFIVLLVVNTAAILEIIYIFAVGRPALKKSEATPAEEAPQETA